MKIEQLLVQHFYLQRKITLQGMGTFTLSPDVIIPLENDKDSTIPENAISFTYNSKSTEDDDLINFIVQQTRKIKPLASADLDSYLVLGKQFLNIGKPFKIEGMGILEKNQLGEYEFKQGHFTSSKMEAAPRALREKVEDEDISFAATRNKPANGKKNMVIAVVVILLAIMGWAAWHFLHNKTQTELEKNNTPPQTISPSISPTEPVSKAIVKKDFVTANPAAVPKNEYYKFRVVFKETKNREAATVKMKNLLARGHQVILYTRDSIHYKLAEPFNLPLSDTARIKDSLNKYFYLGKAFIELDTGN